LKKVKLQINERDIALNEFVASLVEAVTSGLVSNLTRGQAFNNAQMTITGQAVEIFVDNNQLQANDFVKGIIRNTILGMAGSLKGIDTIEKLEVFLG